MLSLCRHLILLIIFMSSLVYATPNQNLSSAQSKANVDWSEMQHVFIDLILQGEWISDISARQNISNSMTEIGLTVGISCSSRDGKKDCYCPGGCWRTETDCGCD